MLLTGEQIAQHLVESEFSKRNQVGIDLSVSKIEQIKGRVQVLKDKTVVNPDMFHTVEPWEVYLGPTSQSIKGWELEPGAYAVTFNEKITIPENATAFIISRSSIYRGGAKINSPIWDPGFTTGDNFMGTTLIVVAPIVIEQNARICQLYMIENYTPKELYNGQFQGKTNY